MSCHCHDHEHEHWHGHSHEHGGGEKGTLYRLFAAAATFFPLLAVPSEGWTRLCCFLVPYLLAGFPVLKEAGENLLHGELLDENFLMAVASIGAFCIGEYPEAVLVMLLYGIGEYCEELAVEKSRRSIRSLMAIAPDTARILRGGEEVTLAPEEVAVGDILLVYPGERIALDGVIEKGSASLDTSALTGESAPRDVAPGDAVRSGCIDTDGALSIRVTRPFGESTVSRILALAESSAEQKSRTESFITRFARIYTPCVVAAAVLLAVLPSLFTGEWSRWLRTALTFLVISCPCALVISVPLTFFGGIGGASRRGILIKGSCYMEALAGCEIAAFDKTGTLTVGKPVVSSVITSGTTEKELLSLAAAAEAKSAHPIAEAIRAAAPGDPSMLEDLRERPGLGITGRSAQGGLAVGNLRLMESVGAELPAEAKSAPGTAVHLALDGKYIGSVLLTDAAKESARGLVGALHALGVKKCVMLTGDREEPAAALASELSLDGYHAALSPEAKVEKMRALRSELSEKGRLLYVGDGVNDAPVLALADVGAAMGLLGTDAAIEAADVVLMDDDPRSLCRAVTISRKTVSIARQNVIFALAVKLAVMALAFTGSAPLWSAVAADVGVCLVCIANALRSLRAG